MKRLSDEEIFGALKKSDGWHRVEKKWLEKRYRFQTFLEGIQFVNDIAKLSEKANHHPFISIDYKIVTLKLTSWREKGITDLDIELIAKYDELYNQMMM